jgi:outer membrane protein OmpA-like peptidoglycan-associated protein
VTRDDLRRRRTNGARPVVRALAAGAALAAVVFAEGARPRAADPPPGPKIPLATGLTIVTAISTKQGDYESIKQIVNEDATSVRLKYSSERPKPFEIYEEPDDKPRPLESTNAFRRMLKKDLQSATQYLQQFAAAPTIPETFPGATAIGVSAAVLQALKTKGASELTIYQTPLGPDAPIKPNREPGEMDFSETGTIRRVEKNPVLVSVIVNNRLVSLPTVHAKGTLVLDDVDFYFLDDPQNPLALKFTIGSDSLTVVKINTPRGIDLGGGGGGGQGGGSGAGAGRGGAAGGGSGAGEGGGAGGGDNIEQSLADTGHVDVYGIYFSFSSDRIREESEPVLRTIAGLMTKHPDWKLAVDGHTDNIGGNAYNQTLSERRAAAVVKALVDRYHVATVRLANAGFGASRPKATNETLAGRALNRRVELVKQ